MVLTSDAVVYYVVCFCLAWLVGWYVVFLVTGFHLTSITVNNGFSFNGITFSTKSALVTVRSLRFRLWGNTRMLIIDGLEVKSKPKKTKSTRKRSKPHKKPSNEAILDKVIVFPSNAVGRTIIKFLICHIPHLDIELRHLTFHTENNHTSSLDYLKFTLPSRYSKRYVEKIKFQVDILANSFTQILGNASKSHHNIDDKPTTTSSKKDPISLTTCRLSVNFSINLLDGQLDNIKVKIFANDTRASIFKAAQSFLSHYGTLDEYLKRGQEDEKEDESTTIHTEEPERKLDKLSKIHNRIHSALSEVAIHIENLHIFEIPIATLADNQNFRDYFKAEIPHSSLDLQIKSLSFNFTKLEKDAAGFEVLFDPKIDIPFHSTCSIQLLKLNFTRLSELKTGNIGKTSDEIVNVPNFSFTHKSNLLDHLAKGRGFKDCVLEFYSSASSPVLDLSTRQLSEIFYNLVLLKKYLKLTQLKKRLFRHSIDTEDEDDTRVEIEYKNDYKKEPIRSRSSYFRDRLFKLLNDYYPRLDSNFVIEQPRFVIRHHDKTKHRIQLLIFSYSLLDFRLSTTTARNYDAKCHVLHPRVTYHEKSDLDSENYSNELIKKEIVMVRSLMFHVEILKNLKVKAYFEINEILVDISKLDILTGINSLLKDVTGMIEKDLSIGVVNLFLNSEIIKIREGLISQPIQVDLQQHTLENKLFRYLPSWFVEAQIHLTSVNILLGSRSVLIPKDLLSSVTGEGLDSDFTDDNHKLRTVRIKSDLISLNVGNNTSVPDNAEFLGDTITSASSSASSETLASFSDRATYWSINSKVTNFNIATLTEINSKSHKYNTLLHLPATKGKISAVRDENGVSNLKFDIEIQDVNAYYDRYKLSAVVGSIYLLTEFVISPIKAINSKLKRDLKRFSSSLQVENSKPPKSMKELLLFELHLVQFDCTLQLSDEFNMRLQTAKSNLLIQNGVITITNYFLRGLVDSPLTNGYWSRIVCADSLKLVVGNPNTDSMLDIYTESIRLVQPHSFIVHKLFDNLSVTIKIAKYLLKCLKDDKQNSDVVSPKESKAIALPKIILNSKKVCFAMDDDPFESELNMIYQLGIVEQRKRLEQYSIFATKVAANPDENYSEKLYNTRKNMATSWIRKVRVFKKKLEEEIIANKKYLFGNEATFNSDYNENVTAYPLQAPLLSIYMDQFKLKISDFDKNIPQFLHDIGQGVPLDTKYTLLVPTYLDLEVGELRMHLRDYPLPLLHIPRNADKSVPSLTMSGHLVIAEALVTNIENMRSIIIPLSPSSKENRPKFNSLEIRKSLSSVKMYTDLACNFNSHSPSRFIWGQSYQFGIQQIMLNFDQFSKPPVDPSMKLGFWDKLRFVLHGKCQINTKKNLEIGFKSAKDPYDLFDAGNGFVLSFRNNIVWKINEDNDSIRFFDITSEKVSWYIPNYLAAPLVSWTRDSSRAVYMPDSSKFVTSCFGYYLDSESSNAKDVTESFIVDKNVVNLRGGVRFRVGFLLERKNDSGERTQESIHHYDINLRNPDYTTEGHDSYKGFRSEYIHMAISLEADKESSYNSIHLSPGTFKQFFDWWGLFASNMMLPIRKGSMFGETKKSMKFSRHLFTNKFLFKFRSLFLSHMYRDESISEESDIVQCVGIRGKMDSFIVDLHQRKEPRILVHEGLDLNKKILKMNFNVGELHLTGIDLRVIKCDFKQELYKGDLKYDDEKSKYSIFDDDKRWFDIQDFEEAYVPSLNAHSRTFSVYPLLFSKRFSYIRDTLSKIKSDDFEEIFGNEVNHDCFLNSKNIYQPQIEVHEDRIKQLQTQVKRNREKKVSTKQLEKRIDFMKSEIRHIEQRWRIETRKASTSSQEVDSKENFHNKFILICMYLKWNFNSRNNFLKYIHFVQLKSNLRKFLSYDAISTLEDLISSNSRLSSDSLASDMLSRIRSGTSELINPGGGDNSQDRLSNFEDFIRRHSANESITEDYLIEIVSPQIQLQSDDCPDSIVLIAAPNIEAKVVSVVDKASTRLLVEHKELENRLGVVLNDANVFVLDKDILDSNNLILDMNSYGSKSNWPPWLGIEVCKSGLWAGEDILLVENLSMMVTYEQTKPLGTSLARINDIESMYNGEEDDDKTKNTMQTTEGSAGAVDRFTVDIPKLVISSTSEQYFTLYVIILSLLFYSEPMSKTVSKRLEELKFSVDFQDLHFLHDRLLTLHSYYRMMSFLNRNYSFRQRNMSNEDLNNNLLLNLERGEVVTEIYLMLQTLLTGDISQDSSSTSKTFWFIRADEIILHMLEHDRTPIVDIAMSNGKFKRTVNENGSDINRIEIGMMQGFNLFPNARYPEFLEPFTKGENFDPDDNLVTVDWTMNRSVGGIKIIENLDIFAQPLSIRLDELTSERLMNFLFGSDTQDVKESPLLNVTAGKDRFEESEETTGLVEQLEGVNKAVTFNGLDKMLDDSSGSEGSRSQRTKGALPSRLTESFNSDADPDHQDQINEMIKRSKKYISIVSLKVNALSLMISIKLTKGFKKLLNVQDLLINLPEFVIERRVISFLEVTKLLEKFVVKTLVHHSGRVLANKLRVQKNPTKHADKPLRPLKAYNGFTNIRDLRSLSPSVERDTL
ncbi:mitochondrial protein [Scheffersomyces xylosifermentans]|uniref:mitochondrial protein n=1 Tax=Scheffersomyces xylosifermentans TaxID=1304137 RepID=UPI00315CD20E